MFYESGTGRRGSKVYSFRAPSADFHRDAFYSVAGRGKKGAFVHGPLLAGRTRGRTGTCQQLEGLVFYFIVTLLVKGSFC